jgi:cellulose synthase (UDP-forming)
VRSAPAYESTVGIEHAPKAVMSNSKITNDRFRQRAALRKGVALIYVLTMLAYLGWRATTINSDAIGLSLVYFAAEFIGFFLGLTVVFFSWDYSHREPPPAPKGVSVDVFITTYKEPVELVRWTIIAAKEIAYPHQTFVLDDGNRPQMKALAEELGVRYFARERNLHAKAGNLNFGLSHSSAEFVMVFDADHIAMPHALDVMLGFFSDKRVALVQAPQDYYNIDAFQFFNARRTGGLWHDQSYFYQIVQPCRDSFNGASCVGTSVVYRRAALDSIGGIPTETVTEDTHTSLKLHKAGHVVVNINEPIAYGIAAADIREYYKTRHRWGHGNIHVLRAENIFSCSGLTLGQRLSYISNACVYLEGWQQLLLFVVPVTSLLLGWAPYNITVLNVLVVLSYPVLAALLLQELGCGLSRYWVNEVFSAARFPVQVVSWWALVRGKMPFRTSSKETRGQIDWLLMLPQLAVCAFSLGAFLFGVGKLIADFRVGPLGAAFNQAVTGNIAAINWTERLVQGYTLELVIVSGFWAIFNASKTGYIVYKAITDARRSADDYRFDALLPLEIDTPVGPMLARVERISRSWLSARVYEAEPPVPGTRLTGTLHLPAGPLPVEAVVTRRLSGNDRRFECELVWPDHALCDRLTRSLYAVDWHREFLHRNAYFSTPLDVLGRLFSLRAPFASDVMAWSPALYRGKDRAGPSFAVVGRSTQGDAATVLAFSAMYPATVIEMLVLGARGLETHAVHILQPEPLRSLASKGLDGATVRKFRSRIITTGQTTTNFETAAAE